MLHGHCHNSGKIAGAVSVKPPGRLSGLLCESDPPTDSLALVKQRDRGTMDTQIAIGGKSTTEKIPDERSSGNWCEYQALSCARAASCLSCCSSCSVFDVAGDGWAKHWPFNGHGFHRIPASPPSQQDQQLPTPSSRRHHLRHSLAHPGTRMICLLEEGGLDLFKIR